MLADEIADTTAEGDAGDSDRAGVAEADRQAVLGERGADVRAGQARAGPGRSTVHVDVELPQLADVEDDAALGRAVTRAAVAAAADRELEARPTGDVENGGDVRSVHDPSDRGRVLVEAAVHDRPESVVVRVAGADHGPPGGRPESREYFVGG